MAPVVAGLRDAGEPAGTEAPSAGGTRDRLLSPGQRALWFLHRLAPDSGAYVIAAASRVGGELDVAALRRALQAVVDRHGALRTTFHEVAGEPVRRVAERMEAEVREVEVDPGAGGAEVGRRLNQAAYPRFELETGPPLRVTVVRGGPAGTFLVLAVHHLVADLWSLGVVVRDLSALYQACHEGREAVPPPTPDVGYDDHVRGRWELVEGERGAVLQAFWEDELAGRPDLLPLPTDRPRPPRPSYRGGAQGFTLDTEAGRRLRRLGRERGANPFMVFLAVFGALLHRMTGADDLVVGTPTSGRSDPRFAEVVGYFVNPVPVRLDLSGDPSFAELLDRVRDAARRALDHQDLPFPALVERLEPARDPSRSPIFQAMFSLQKTVGAGRRGLAGFAVGREGASLRLGDLPLEAVPLDSPWAQFDLSLGLTDGRDGAAGRLAYASDLFDATTAARIASSFASLAAGAAERPEVLLSELPVLSPGQLHQTVHEWRERPEGYPGVASLEKLLTAGAARGPDAVAVTAGGRHLSHGELDRRARALAAALHRGGVGPGSVVGLFAGRSPELVVGVRAIVAAGAVYLPLDPAYPDERLRFMLADSGARTVLAAGRARERLEPWLADLDGGRVVPLEGGADDPLPPPVAVTVPFSDLTAYLIYTSGSTGAPKGVAVPHRAVANLLARRNLDVGPSDAILVKAPISFDVSVVELLMPLAAGGRMVLLPPGAQRDPEALLGEISRERVTLAAFPPSMAAPLLDAGLGRCRSLRALGLGIEAVLPELVERLFDALGEVDVFNRYGPTEATVFATEWRCVRGEVGRVVPIGRSTAGAELLVVDARLLPVPPGVPGELCLGGPGLARGYRGRRAATAEGFVPHPWARSPGQRIYRTGDEARFRADGAVEFLGRLDQQVKVRGFRVEPGEIEAVLTQDPRVREAAVLNRPHPTTGAARLAAYVVPRRAGRERSDAEPEGDDLAAALQATLAERLPDYMVPRAFVILDRFPLTPNGKVDRRALPEPAWGEGGEDVAPRGPVESALAALYRDLLGVDAVGAGSDFFTLGGHSLLATRLISRVRETLGVELPVRAVFEHPTVAGLAAAVQETGSGAAPPLEPRLRPEAVPLSFAQERLWFLAQMEPDSPAYLLPGAIRLTGVLDAAVLAASLSAVVRRHEALRTVFRPGGEDPFQEVLPVGSETARRAAALPVVDLARLPAPLRENEALRVARAEASRPFDLARGPLQRTVLARLGDREHRLVMVQHHVVSDGWSVGVFVRELSEHYRARIEQREPSVPELPVQYADYALWQRDWLGGEALAELLAWWRQELAGAPPVLELPTDRPRPAARSYRGGRVRRSMDGVAAGVEAVARAVGATPFMVWAAAAGALLGRLAGRDEVLLGTPVAGRTRREVEDLVGFFVNTLVLRVDLSGAPSFSELVGRVRDRALGAFAHQDVPFERLVEELAPRRDLATTPLFQVVLAYQSATGEALELPGVELEWLEAAEGVAKFDLTLDLLVAGSGLVARLDHDRDLFDGATVRRWAAALERLTASAVAAPERPVGELALLSSAERQQVLAEWGGERVAYPEGSSLADLVVARSAARPDAVALVAGEGRWSYGDIEARSRRLAAELRDLGVGPEVPVGVCLERSAELVVALLAVLRAGGFYVPLDPSYPRERLALMLEDAGVGVVLSQGSLAGALPARAHETVLLDGLCRGPVELPGSGESELPEAAGPDSLAYLMYTSGSTGRPKGVAVTRRNVVRLVSGNRFAGFGPEAVYLQLAPSAFDASTLEIWAPLVHGGRLEVFPPHAPSLEELGGYLHARRVTDLWLTAGLFHQMVEERPEDLGDLETLLAGGDVLSPGAVARGLAALGPGATLVNGYGPTEGTTFTSCHAMPAGEERDRSGGPVPIGRPIANTSVHLLDPEGAPVPVGVAGELLAGGLGLARGYWRRPELTAERFVPDPLGRPGERLYRTGDLARWRPDGRVEFLGRMDHQVKLRGFRIEPGEVEAVLAHRPEVAEAAVVVRGSGEERYLAAYVSPAGDGTEVSGEELRRRLGEELPEHLVPRYVMVLPELPLTPNGKVDRRSLVDAGPEPERPDVAEAEAPRTPIEEILAGLFQTVLDLERVGVHDDFFDLGGHSLLATRLVSRVREAFGLEVPVRAVFEHPTVAGLAAVVDGAEGGRGEEAIPEALDRAAAPPSSAPVSFAQARLWFLAQLDPGSSAYHLPGVVRMRGRLDLPALGAAVSAIVRRHEALRTVFEASGEGGAVQVVRPEGWREPARIAAVDLSALPGGRRDVEARRRLLDDVRRPFDLEAGPLLRVSLFRLDGDEHLLVVNTHHVVSDGWSVAIFVRDLAELYAAAVARRPPELPKLPIQYRQFSAWQRERLRGEVLESLTSWWRDELAGAPGVLELPLDRPRPPVQTFRGGRLRPPLLGDLAAAIEGLAQSLGATPFMVWLAALGALLGRLAGQEEVVVGSPIAGRTRSETEGLIGFFVNTLALRVDLSGDPTFEELVARVRERALGAYAHQELPFERLVEMVAPQRDLATTPLFQVLFAYQNTPWERLDLPGVELDWIDLPGGTAKFDLTVDLAEEEGGLRPTLDYNRDLFDGTTVGRWAESLELLVSAAVAEPERRVGELPLLGPAARQQVLAEWNDTAPAPAPGGRAAGETLAAAFLGTAGARPEAVALVTGEETVSYGELARRSSAVARRLRLLGVGPEVRVGVCAGRSVELVAALLGVLEAGGAYVPLDPAYPAERVRFMLEDSGARVVLAEAEPAARLGLGASGGPEVLDLTELAGAGPEATAPEEPVSSSASGDHLAYLIYTSGSTGRPKGVAIPHRAARALVSWSEGVYGPDLLDGVLAVTSVCFDLSVFELFVPLTRGGRVVLVDDALALAEAPEAGRAVLLNTVPSVLSQVLALDGVPPSVRGVNLAGEPLQRSLVDALYRARPGVERVWDLYGPSEDTTYSTGAEAGREAEGEPRIGAPIEGTRAYVLDRSGRPAPVGVPGELLLAGAGLARGYLGRPARTASVFVPDPFVLSSPGTPGSRLYRTGDLARWGVDGELEYLGRLDHQVKLRGYRIELGEVEAALLARPEVREAAAVAPGAGTADGRLVAYVVPAAEAPAGEELAERLRASLRERLPGPLVPDEVATVEALPLTPSGKVDRRSLTDRGGRPASGPGLRGEVSDPPETAVEVALATLFAEVLGVATDSGGPEGIGVRDDFFALGGHSLKATQVLLRVHETFGVQVPVRRFFEEPTVAGLAVAVAEALIGDDEPAVEPADPEEAS